MRSSSNSVLPYATLLGAQLAVGAAAIFARYALHGADATMVSALRLTIAAVPLLVMQHARTKAVEISGRENIYLFIAGAALALHFVSWIASLSLTTIAISTMLVSTTPAWTALYETLIEKRERQPMFWLVLGIMAFGVALMNVGKSAPPPWPGLEWQGCALALTGALSLAIYLLLVKPQLRVHGTLAVVSRTYSAAAATLWIAALLHQDKLPGLDPACWFGIIAMACISQLIGHTGINASLKYFSANTVAMSTLIEPVAAASLAFSVFGEYLSCQGIIGGGLILAGLLKVLSLEAVEKA